MPKEKTFIHQIIFSGDKKVQELSPVKEGGPKILSNTKEKVLLVWYLVKKT